MSTGRQNLVGLCNILHVVFGGCGLIRRGFDSDETLSE
jgi:hypothetical protein